MQTTKGKINQVAAEMIERIEQDLEAGYFERQNLVLFVGQISARKWYIGYNYQKNLQVGDTIVVPHPEDYITQPKVYHTFS